MDQHYDEVGFYLRKKLDPFAMLNITVPDNT